ncbi:MAG: PD40 domain-containing protein, partial [Acidobacteria bacterium]|nr:PD40 domain-containing protein [Acidobacteriota bacterium]
RILGTMYYMAPEQVEGKTKEIDGRADIFSFGAVVYEMATGKRAFEGQTKASVMAKILEHNPPPMSTLQPMTPPALDSVVKTCLAKDREDRVQTARDLCRELKWIKEASSQAVAATATPQPATKLWQRVLPWAVAAVAIVVALLAVFLPSRSATPTAPMRFSVSPPENTSLLSDLAERTPLISPDGQRLAFVARGSDDINMLWVRPLDSLTAQPLPGTEGASTPFWSVDSRFLGFIAERKLKKIEVSGGPPQTLAAPGDGGGTWNSQGEIVFRRGNTLSRVSAAGGEATPVTTLNQSRQEGMHVRPDFLPDGRHFLYFASSANPENNGVYAGSLDSQETVRLLNANSMAQYAPPGYLLFVRGDALMAQPFNATRLQLTGEAFPVAAQVYADPTYGSAAFSVSNNGVLVYRTGVGNFRSQLTWFDRTGKQIGTVGPPGVYFNPKLSPDGKRVAVEQVTSGNRDIWILDIERGIATRFTFDATDELDPLWSPDGKYIAFVSTRDSLRSLYQKLSSGAGSEEVLLKGAVGTIAHDWSLDGRFITYRPSAGIYIWVLPLFGDRKPFSYLQPEFGVASSQISPDGKWLAYRSNESGRWEGFVQSFPKPGAKWQVSANGGAQPRWRRDGKELFYIALDGKLMAVPIKGEESLEIGTPQALFETRTAGGASALPTSLAQYDVSSDGQRFLMNVGPEAASTIPITVVLNWLAGVKR